MTTDRYLQCIKLKHPPPLSKKRVTESIQWDWGVQSLTSGAERQGLFRVELPWQGNGPLARRDLAGRPPQNAEEPCDL